MRADGKVDRLVREDAEMERPGKGWLCGFGRWGGGQRCGRGGAGWVPGVVGEAWRRRGCPDDDGHWVDTADEEGGPVGRQVGGLQPIDVFHE